MLHSANFVDNLLSNFLLRILYDGEEGTRIIFK